LGIKNFFGDPFTCRHTIVRYKRDRIGALDAPCRKLRPITPRP